MFYIISHSYRPNTAVNNHTMSFLQGFSELGVKAEKVFIMADLGQPRMTESFDGISVRYLWKPFFSRNRVLSLIYKHLSYGWFYLFVLKKGDTVMLMGTSPFLHFLVRKKGVKVFHERTEHPKAVRASRYAFLRKSYNADCARANGMFVISKALKDYFESVGVPSSMIHVINMVVDANRFVSIKKNMDAEPYIAYCGNASNSKDGVDDLIKAFSIVAKQNKEIKLYIIGNSPILGSDNHQLVEDLGLVDRIVFTGIVPASKMPQLLCDAKMLALCRPNTLQNKYGFPTKLGEYLLTGNPVVITRVGDIPLFLEHKKTALMSDCKDIEAFADNMLWVLNHPDEAKKIGLNGKKVAEQNFNYLTETKKMCDIMFNVEQNG